MGKIIFNSIGENSDGHSEIFTFKDKYLGCMSKANGHLFKQRLQKLISSFELH